MSKRRGRSARPTQELKQELLDQLQLLRNACVSFDNGLEAAGKDIAVRIRVLVHELGGSRALLEQLGLRSIKFFDSAGALNPRNLIAECNLISLRLTINGGHYEPAIVGGMVPQPMRRVSFLDWWNKPVLKDGRGRTFSRRELLHHVANTDGGAHVDPKLDEAYMALSRGNSLGWNFENANGSKPFAGRPELACMRQMAHELLSTIHKGAPEFAHAAEPIIPRQSC